VELVVAVPELTRDVVAEALPPELEVVVDVAVFEELKDELVREFDDVEREVVEEMVDEE